MSCAGVEAVHVAHFACGHLLCRTLLERSVLLPLAGFIRDTAELVDKAAKPDGKGLLMRTIRCSNLVALDL